MPLRCKSPDGPVFAYLQDAESWQALTASNRKSRHLSMPCCLALVVLKKSSLGTQFFAHKSTGGCASAPESLEHLLAKELIARAAIAAGWNAITEATDNADSPWIADVLCSRAGHTARVAFEVQRARQTPEETERRQAAYGTSGVRSLWLMRQQDLPISKHVPAFRLVYAPAPDPFEVWLPSERYSTTAALRARKTDNDWGQRIELGRFVMGALSGALKFDPLLDRTVEISVSLSATTCFNCHREIRIVDRMTVDANGQCAGLGSFSFSLDELQSGLPGFMTWIEDQLPPDRLRVHGAGPLKPRFSRMMQVRYLSNGCVHCGVLQGRLFAHEAHDVAPILLTAHLHLTRALLEACPNAVGMRRWWFDSSNG